MLSSVHGGAKTTGTRHEIAPYFDRMDIPANTISSVQKLDSSCLMIMCKDLRPILCSFEPNDLFVTTLVNAIEVRAPASSNRSGRGGANNPTRARGANNRREREAPQLLLLRSLRSRALASLPCARFAPVRSLRSPQPSLTLPSPR